MNIEFANDLLALTPHLLGEFRDVLFLSADSVQSQQFVNFGELRFDFDREVFIVNHVEVIFNP